jgi:hypothetical protein
MTVKPKNLIREGREGTRRKARKNNGPLWFTSRHFASFADKKGFPA